MGSSNQGFAGLCTLFGGGAVTCFVFGIMYLSSPNGFEANKQAYIRNIADYRSDNYGRLEQSAAFLDTARPMVTDVTFINNYGKNAALMPQNVAALSFSASNVDWTLNHTMSIRFPGSPALQIAAPSPANQSIGVVKVKCTSKDGCDKYKMREMCQKASCPEGMLFSGPGKAGAGEEKNCFYVESTPYVCMVVEAADDGSWQLSPTMRYCDWPFSSPRRACGYANASIPYYIRASNDPYVVLQQLTKGSMDFGLTSSQQTLYGALLVGGGILLLFLNGLNGLVIYLYFCRRGCSCRSDDASSSTEPQSSPKVDISAVPTVGVALPAQIHVEPITADVVEDLQWKAFDPPGRVDSVA